MFKIKHLIPLLKLFFFSEKISKKTKIMSAVFLIFSSTIIACLIYFIFYKKFLVEIYNISEVKESLNSAKTDLVLEINKIINNVTNYSKSLKSSVVVNPTPVETTTPDKVPTPTEQYIEKSTEFITTLNEKQSSDKYSKYYPVIIITGAFVITLCASIGYYLYNS